MTPYDAVMAALVVAGLVWGTWKGLTWQLASMTSLVLGYTVAHTLSGQLAPQFPGPPVAARALAMLTIYVVVSGGIFLIAWLIRATLRRLKFEAYDRHLGMILGGLEGGSLGIVGTLFVISLLPQTRGPIFASPTGHVVCQVMNAVGPVLPSEVRAELAPFWTSDGGGLTADQPATTAPSPVAEEGPRPLDRVESGATDPNIEQAQGLVDQAESRIGRAIIQEAEKELGAGQNARAVERR